MSDSEDTGGVIVTEAQAWSLIGLLGAAIVASPTIIVLYIRAEISGLGREIGGLRRDMGSQIGGLCREMELRFEAMDRRFDHLDRDVAALANVVFPER